MTDLEKFAFSILLEVREHFTRPAGRPLDLPGGHGPCARRDPEDGEPRGGMPDGPAHVRVHLQGGGPGKGEIPWSHRLTCVRVCATIAPIRREP